jgi:predicted regulator of Ras-like GTPase activity (Roadblock/LC7/MglB family)
MQNDIESLVSGIKQLNALLVVTIPDCLLVSSWLRDGQSWDVEAAGSFLGQLVHSSEQGEQAIDGWTTGLSAITLESDNGLIIVRQLKEPFAVAYVFDQGTAIGWARLQVQRTLDSVTEQLDGVAPPAPKPAPKPAAAPVTAKPAEQKSPSSSGDQDATPKGTRLLKYLDTHAPDTHAALLRVSLQTGLPLTLLRMPDSLSDDEFAQVEESVRRILGVDQLNF